MSNLYKILIYSLGLWACLYDVHDIRFLSVPHAIDVFQDKLWIPQTVVLISALHSLVPVAGDNSRKLQALPIKTDELKNISILPLTWALGLGYKWVR